MPAVAPEELVAAITNATTESGYSATLISRVRTHPRRFAIAGPSAPAFLSVYAWTLTFGGRRNLPNEYRIQMTSVSSPLALADDGPTILIGYDAQRELFAGFDLERHRTFTPGSSSVQIDITELRKAETDGLSFDRKSNDEIAVGIRPDMFMAYAMNAAVLHQYGRDANVRRLLTQAVEQRPIPRQQVDGLSTERRRVIAEVSRLSRDASFRQRVLFAYGHRCAVTRIQLRLVEAAHILPVGAPGSDDSVSNGISLSPTYHRAFDAGLIYLDRDCNMRLNDGRLNALQAINLAGGIEAFRQPLGQIFLPPDPAQRPHAELIRRANRFRQIPG